MRPGRPPKRPGEPDIESPDSQQAKCKLPRLDRGGTPNDFSSVVKSKLSSYTRTGQACDRCKVRKIRCDALPEGCSHCINQNLECYVTDRVTGRTERRGYMQELEREKTHMINHIRDLEKLLGSNGVEVKPFKWIPAFAPEPGYPSEATYDSTGHPVREDSSLDNKEKWTHIANSVWIKPQRRKTQFSSISKSMLEARPADVHLGVGADQAPLSSIKGTALSILGSTIDIGSYDAPDMDEPAPGTQARSALYNKSVQAFMQSCTNVNPQLHVEYPPRADAFTYAEWYFLMLYPFLPVLHKPSFMNLLARLYDDPNFKPSVSEVVMVHMVFASIYFHYGVRNRENPEQKARLNELSNKHYHFSLSKYFDLSTSKTFSDVQALTMIAVHTRCFPKPDCSSMLTWSCHGLAVELGLHRAMKKAGEGTNLENEMRKRVWWTIMEMGIGLNGRMGKPMNIRLEDVDAEFPEMIPDEQLTKDGVDTARGGKCLFEIGAVGFKLSAVYLEMYSHIYCARRDPDAYPAIVEELEARVDAWREELPDSLKNVDGESQYEVFALYAEYVTHEFRLCLRHPSVAMTNDPKMMAENTRVCEKAAKDMLTVAHKLYKLKSLDTTWCALSEYIAAMFTSLVVVWERRHETSMADLDALRGDMSMWLAILTETCDLMGSGLKIRDAVSSIVDRTIAWIEHDRQRKVSASDPSLVSQDLIKQSPQTASYSHVPNGATNPTSNQNDTDPATGPTSTPTSGLSSSRNGYYGETAAESTTYPPLPYNDPSAHASSNMSYDAENPYLYAQTGQVTVAHVQAQVQTQTQVASHNPLSNFAAQATQMAQPDAMMWRGQEASGGNTWHDWTAAVVDSQDRYSANALMSLGAGTRTGSDVNDGPANTAEMGMGVGMNGTGVPTAGNMQWPLLLFHDGTGVGGT
ncbi:hypothetical protein BJ170DRAFT_596672 [Xylariales sp. AK1849]|nr:hypothetical protein BJ170DRAFT_596672 [Xylariales sp. AK1849]